MDEKQGKQKVVVVQNRAQETHRNLTREQEEHYLQDTVKVIRSNVASYGSEVARMSADIDEMLEHYHDDDPEVYTILNNSITLHEHMKRSLAKNAQALKKPYFGRIDFFDEGEQKEESLYIGRGGIARDRTHWMVVDWRAPVATAYYENGLGECSYKAPQGVTIPINLELKRTYEVDGDHLIDFYDSEAVANDELLTKYLAKNKQAVLGEIIATIQKEQNDIIRRSPFHNVIVQGVAGSGKTTVAMHRISYILYNYPEDFKPEDFYIVGSNRILLNYITGVLPELDVYGVRQMTMEQLFVRLLYEDWDEQKYRIVSTGQKDVLKGTAKWYRELETYCRRLEWRTIPRDSIYLNRRQFVEGFRDGTAGVHDESEEKNDSKDLIQLTERDMTESYIKENPQISIQSKIDMLNNRLVEKVKNLLTGKEIQFTQAEKREIRRTFHRNYGAKTWKSSIFDLYQEFLAEQRERGYEVSADSAAGDLDVYDLAALAYLYKRVKETDPIREAHHVVIDEAQDFGMMAYSVLKFCMRGCTYTIMGDVSQNIHFGFGLNDWEKLKELILTGDRDSFGILTKSYRNTVEISEYATKILKHGRFSVYPVEPIIRHGDQIIQRKADTGEAMLQEAVRVLKSWQAKGHDTIAVVCRNEKSAAQTAKELSKLIPIVDSDLETAVFESGIMVLPVAYTKGLEFDAVLILDPTREDYPSDDGHAKLLYVAATRALHELCVLYTGDLTGLIADPIPEQSIRIVQKEPETGRKTALQNKRMASRTGVEEVQNKPDFIRNKPTIPQNRSTAILQNRSAALSQNRSAVLSQNELAAVPQPEPLTRQQLIQRQLAIQKAQQPVVQKQPETPQFGDLPDTSYLKVPGHAKSDQSIKWVQRKADGLYLQSRSGVLRISPVSEQIVRVTFSGNGQIRSEAEPGITVAEEISTWYYKESSSQVELQLDELMVCVDKQTGAISYRTGDKKLLLAEHAKECRLILPPREGSGRSFLFVEWQKQEKLYAFNRETPAGMPLKGTARYISNGDGQSEFPLLISDHGYGILPATHAPVYCCDIPVYGSYLHMESEQVDFYFLAGAAQKDILDNYACLTGGKHR